MFGASDASNHSLPASEPQADAAGAAGGAGSRLKPGGSGGGTSFVGLQSMISRRNGAVRKPPPAAGSGRLLSLLGEGHNSQGSEASLDLHDLTGARCARKGR